MPINVATDLWPMVEAELPRLRAKHAADAETIDALATALREQYGERVFQDLREVLKTCASIEEHPFMEDLSDETKKSIANIRRALVKACLDSNPRFTTLGVGQMDPDHQLRDDNEEFGTFDATGKNAPREALKETMGDYLALAGQLGEAQLMQVLLRLGIITQSDVPTASRILKSYLGVTTFSGGKAAATDWIFTQTPEFLRDPSVHELVHRLLRQAVYETMRERGCDTRMMHKRTLNDLGRIARATVERLCKQAKVDPAAHEGLIARMEQEWWDIANLEPGEGMVTELEAEGDMHPFPSLRQRIALSEIRRQQHLYVGFEPGLGKTAVAMWSWHDLNQQRAKEKKPKTQQCYVVSPEALDDLSTTTLGYFTEGNKPTVGVIRGGVSDKTLEEALQKDIVFVSSKMLHIERNGIALYERLRSHKHAETGEPFGMLTVDEAHQFKGDKTMTDVLDALISKTPKLHKEGRVLFMSGTPATNDLSDIVVQLGLLENKRGGQKTNMRDTQALDPIDLRNRLNRVLIVDPPISWQAKIESCGYDLSVREQQLVRMIVQNESLNPAQKRDLILRAIRTPDLTSGDGDMPCSLFEWQSTFLKEDLKTKPTVLIAEFMQAQGVLRDFDNRTLEDDEVERLFFLKIQRTCQEWEAEHGIPVRFHVIHGRVSLADREKAFADSRESAANMESSRTVIVTFSSCVNLGKDLRSVKKMHTLQYPFNMPELQQLLMRSLRAGHENISLRAFYANDTVEEGILDYSRDKYRRVMSCLYGGSMSDAELKALTENDADGMKSKRIQRMLMSPERQREKREQHQHGRGSKYMLNFARKHEYDFREELKNADGMGHMDHQRFIAGLVGALETKGIMKPGTYLHTHGQGAFLQRMLSREAPNPDRTVTSIETLQSHADEGAALLKNGERAKAKTIVGTLSDVGRNLRLGTLEAESMDAVILDGIAAMKGASREGTVTQRVRAIVQSIRTLKEGGTLVVPLSRNACTKEEFERLQRFLGSCGVEIIRSWTGEATSTDNDADAPFRMFTIVGKKTQNPSAVTVKAALAEAPLTLTHRHHWGDTTERARLDGERRRRMAPAAIVHRHFKIGTHAIETNAYGGDYLMQREHLAALKDAAAAVRSIIDTPKALWTDGNKIDVAIRAKLRDAGVEFLPSLTPRKDRPAFVLKKYPDHLFYPFDQQWKAAE